MAFAGETVGTGAPGPEQNPDIKGPMVMHSTAGYYIGFEIFDHDYGFAEPYSRESGYFSTREAAEKALPNYIPRDSEFHPGPITIEELT